MAAVIEKNSIGELLRLLENSCSRRFRTYREFAEQEIIIPDGPFAGKRFRCWRQPYSALWFDALDSGLWRRFWATGPTQSGKTLTCYAIPILYHIFELQETVVCGVPDMEMAGDKWREDLLPVILRTRYRDLLPSTGGGSRGGSVTSIKFRNGATLKFMSGGGGDKSRAGFTTSVVAVTEADGMDESGGNSREADKISQMEARARAYGQKSKIYGECTTTVESGRVWREYKAGTKSRICVPCVHCGEYVTPEREHIQGWVDAENIVDARANSAWHCPKCGEGWSESAREIMNRGAVLAHRGQDVLRDGSVVGDAPLTDTLSFRWNAFNNMFWTAGDVGRDEWRGMQDEDEENAEKELCQFVHALPYTPPHVDTTPLDAKTLQKRQDGYPKGMLPEDTEHVTVFVDVGKWLCHWALLGWRPGATCQIADYGRFEVPSNEMQEEKAILAALREFRDRVAQGWVKKGHGESVLPGQVWVDSGYQPEPVYTFCRESGKGWYATKGYGAAQGVGQGKNYSAPKKKNADVKLIGLNYHFARLTKERIVLVHINADFWKTWVHRRLSSPSGEPGAMRLFDAVANDHMSFTKHLTAEKQVTEFVPGKGEVVRWEVVRPNNHWLDCVAGGSAAGHFCGVRLLGEGGKPRPPQAAYGGGSQRTAEGWKIGR